MKTVIYCLLLSIFSLFTFGCQNDITGANEMDKQKFDQDSINEPTMFDYVLSDYDIVTINYSNTVSNRTVKIGYYVMSKGSKCGIVKHTVQEFNFTNQTNVDVIDLNEIETEIPELQYYINIMMVSVSYN